MRRLLQSFLLLLATATDRELARMVEFLKEENRILRSKLPKRIPVTPQERDRLVRLGKRLGSKVRDLISIVSPRTFLRWVNGEGQKTTGSGKPGRKRTPEEIRDLVLRLARENDWGYTRILGELKKLGVCTISRNTVKNILRENGLDPGPKRGQGTWDEFLKRHAQSLWACDFFSTKVWTLGGRIDIFVLFFIHIGTRRVHLAGVTAHPDKAWVVQQARNLSMIFADEPVKPRLLLRDHDSKFVPEFDQLFASDGIEVKAVGPLAPNMNPHAERWVQAVKQECLDHFVIFGESHLRYLLTEYLAYYHNERPHQALGNLPPLGLAPPESEESVLPGDIVCEERLGGLLKHYRRRAA